MNADLEKSLRIAKLILSLEIKELKTLTIILQTQKDLSDNLVVVMAEICNQKIQRIKYINECIDNIKNDISIFGKKGEVKEIETVPKENYPPNQRFC